MMNFGLCGHLARGFRWPDCVAAASKAKRMMDGQADGAMTFYRSLEQSPSGGLWLGFSTAKATCSSKECGMIFA